MLKKIKQYNKGQIIMLSLLIFLGISVSTIFAVSLPVIQHIKIARDSYTSKQSFYAAEALNEDILYRLNHNLAVSTSETLTIGDADVTADITNVSGGKEITVLSEQDGIERKIKSGVQNTVGISFNYGLQVGTGGFFMDNNASVIGNAYVNGNITGGTITGTAIAANSAAQFSDQSNIGSTTPTQSIIFRNTASTQDLAQSFQVSTTSNIQKIQLYMKKVGSPTDATVRILTNNSGSPSTTNLLTTQGTLSASQVTTSYGWVDIVLPSTAQLTAGTTYWFVIDNSTQSAANYYEIAADTGYANGTGKVGAYSGTWNSTSPSGLDTNFTIYLGGSYSTISGVTVGVDAWAHTVTGGSVAGVKYCQSGTGCNTSRPDPSPQGYPISDANIAQWKADALAGGTISSFTATSTSNLGPKKINGDLTINNNNTLYIEGALWVTGNIIVDNGATVRLPANYGTAGGIIVNDGKISIGNNSTFSGSGQAGSYILLLTTSDCPASPSCSGDNAIELANNGGAVILNAQNGTLHINNNAGAKEAIAKTIVMDNGATVTYESGLSDANFSSGPGGTFSIDAWQEIE